MSEAVNRKTPWLPLALLLLSVGVNIWLWNRPKPAPVEIEKRVEVPVPAVDESPTSLATAIKLLPNQQVAYGGRKLSDGKYWVWTEEMNEVTGGYDQIGIKDESWFVDTNAKKATKLAEYNSGPSEITPVATNVSEAQLAVAWHWGWEGTWTDVEQRIDKATGAVAFESTNENGNSVRLASKGKSVSVSLAPAALCEPFLKKKADGKATATGLMVNGVATPLPKPVAVTCTYNAVDDTAAFTGFTVGWRDDAPAVSLPGATAVFSAEDLTFKEFAK